MRSMSGSSPPRPGLTTQQNIYRDLIELGLDPSIARERMHDPILIATHRQHHKSAEQAARRPEHLREYTDYSEFGGIKTCLYHEGDADIIVCASHKLEFCATCCVDYTDMNNEERQQARGRYAAVEAASNATLRPAAATPRMTPDEVQASFLPAWCRGTAASSGSESERSRTVRKKGSRKKSTRKAQPPSSGVSAADSSTAAVESSSAFQPREIHVAFAKCTYTELAPGTQIKQRCSELRGTIVETAWEGQSNGVDCVGEEMWEKDPISGEIMPAYLVQYENEQSELVLCSDVHDEWDVITTDVSNDALDAHLATQASSSLSIASSSKETESKEEVSSLVSHATNQDSQAPSIPPSVATSKITSRETRHGNERFDQRGYVTKQFQRAIKAANANSRLPGLPNKGRPTWLIVHENVVFCTDEGMKTMITAWPIMEQGDQVLIKKLTSSERCELNGRVGKLLEYQDGRWLVDLPAEGELELRLPAERTWIELKNLKPRAVAIDS